nr:hypothetical protein GCM10020063_042410 [Dactylosporangium thailandense]
MTESDRVALRERYLLIPRHLRHYALGDMDRKDHPLRVLISAVGEPRYGDRGGREVTAAMHASAVEYFRRRQQSIAEWEARTPPDGPAAAAAAPISIHRTVYPQGWPDDPSIQALQNDYPAAVRADGRDYPSVTHAYWALSTDAAAWHDRIASAPRGSDAAGLAAQAPGRPGRPPGWP